MDRSPLSPRSQVTLGNILLEMHRAMPNAVVSGQARLHQLKALQDLNTLLAEAEEEDYEKRN